TIIPTVTALANGQFLLEDQDQKQFLIVNNSGAVVSSYTVPTGVFGLVAPTTDSGALWVENYAGTDGVHYDLKAEDWNSGYLEIPATVTAPSALAFADTTA